MAYSVDKNTLVDGPRHVIVRCNAVSDGTLTAGQDILIDKSGLVGPNPGIEPTKLVLEEVWYSIQGYEAINLWWDHGASDTIIATLSGDGYQDFRSYGGISDDGSTGTGDVIWTNVGTDTSGDTFSITLKMRKKA